MNGLYLEAGDHVDDGVLAVITRADGHTPQVIGASMIVRGLRAVADFEYEFQMVGMNRALDREVETVFLMAEARHQAIASKLVKEICRLEGDVSKFVTPRVNEALLARLRS